MLRSDATSLRVYGAPSPLLAAVVRHSREAMRRGSLSFFFASRFLAPESRAAVRMLYSWCRACDDIVDHAREDTSASERTMVLDELRRKTWAAVRGKGGGAGDEAFAALASLMARHRFPEVYLQDLLDGLEMDVEGRRYETFAELKVYCYRVAGVVGRMFAYLVGVTGEEALHHAGDLGMAMQMTNIARDVLDDHALGRCYLPKNWLGEAGLDETTAFAPENRVALAAVTARLLDAAAQHYRSGDAGLRFLPARTAFAVSVAREVYAAIGVRVRRRGPLAWDRRVVVPLAAKIFLIGTGIRHVLVSRRFPLT